MPHVRRGGCNRLADLAPSGGDRGHQAGERRNRRLSYTGRRTIGGAAVAVPGEGPGGSNAHGSNFPSSNMPPPWATPDGENDSHSLISYHSTTITDRAQEVPGRSIPGWIRNDTKGLSLQTGKGPLSGSGIFVPALFWFPARLNAGLPLTGHPTNW